MRHLAHVVPAIRQALFALDPERAHQLVLNGLRLAMSGVHRQQSAIMCRSQLCVASCDDDAQVPCIPTRGEFEELKSPHNYHA